MRVWWECNESSKVVGKKGKEEVNWKEKRKIEKKERYVSCTYTNKMKWKLKKMNEKWNDG